MSILQRLGAQSRIQRFLGPKPVLTERDRTIITQVDGWRHAGVIAFAGSHAQPVGAAHYVRSPDGEAAEVAIEVVDDWQRRGIGRRLSAALVLQARRAGVGRLEWTAFESNRAVAALARKVGECTREPMGDGVVKWSTSCRMVDELSNDRLGSSARSPYASTKPPTSTRWDRSS
jgi:RimJ/RimL family protein N-acetyltransferase